MIDPLTKARKQGSDAMKEPALSSSAGGAGGAASSAAYLSPFGD